MTKANTGIWEFTIKHFTLYRMNTYLRSSLGSYERAVALYRWNSELASAYWEAIAYIEVALRNLLDRKMTQRQISLGRSTHWIFDDSYELGRSKDPKVVPTQPFKEISDAMRRVRKNGKPLTPDQIISKLSFGFNQLAGSIDEELVSWIGYNSRINQLIKNYPMKSHLLP